MEAQNCQICDQTVGHDFCNDCRQLFCKTCKLAHLRTKSCSMHIFTHRGESAAMNQVAIIRQEISCENHLKPLEFNCSDCDVPICRSCMAEVHFRHNIERIEDSIYTLKSGIMKVGEAMLQANTEVNKINKGIEKYKIDIENGVKAVINEGNALKEVIDQTIQSIISPIKEREERHVKKLSEVAEGLKERVDKGNMFSRRFIEIEQATRDQGTKFVKLKQLKREMENVQFQQVNKIQQLPSVKYRTNANRQAEKTISSLFGTMSMENLELITGDVGNN